MHHRPNPNPLPAQFISPHPFPLPPIRTPFVRKTAAAIDRHDLIKPNARVLLAVSGGADSMALLAAFAQLATRSHRNYTLLICYVHHHLRPEAAAEQKTVANAAEQLGYEFHPASIYPAEADKTTPNLAARARKLRSQALQNIAAQHHAQVIATAHHGSDQLETILLNLLRGAGTAGLAAMPWRTTPSANHANTVPIIRPLLDQAHQDCLDLCRHLNWPYHEDQSNQDQTKRRNLLRAQVVPLLRQITPDLETRIHRTTDLLTEATSLIAQAVDTSFPAAVTAAGTTTWSRSALCGLNNLILGAGLRRNIQNLTGAIDAISHPMLEQLISAIRDHATHPRTFHWPNNLKITLTNHHLQFHLPPPPPPPSP